MSAISAGWLSFTPRSSRRRATIAAIASSSLSFSRGVRFISATPHARHRPALAQAVEREQHVVPQEDRKSVVQGKSVSVRVDLGGRRVIKKQKQKKKQKNDIKIKY